MREVWSLEFYNSDGREAWKLPHRGGRYQYELAEK